jgi:hypothetical protein
VTTPARKQRLHAAVSTLTNEEVLAVYEAILASAYQRDGTRVAESLYAAWHWTRRSTIVGRAGGDTNGDGQAPPPGYYELSSLISECTGTGFRPVDDFVDRAMARWYALSGEVPASRGSPDGDANANGSDDPRPRIAEFTDALTELVSVDIDAGPDQGIPDMGLHASEGGRDDDDDLGPRP